MLIDKSAHPGFVPLINGKPFRINNDWFRAKNHSETKMELRPLGTIGRVLARMREKRYCV